MCGIIGAVSQRDVVNFLLEGLRRLEYRGYDSAGIAVLDGQSALKRVRSVGKINLLEQALLETNLSGQLGIAHTRWATHGKPSEENAHPHLSHDELAVVHNGIIENHEELRHRLKALGYHFVSETDTEVAAHLIHYHYQNNTTVSHEYTLLVAVQAAAAEMKGAFSLCVMHEHSPHEVVGLRMGSPLVVGMGSKENFIASDALALRGYALSVIHLEDGDAVRLAMESVTIYDAQGNPVQRSAQALSDAEQTVSKGVYRHFMLKEIFEQGEVLKATIANRAVTIDSLISSFGDLAQRFFSKINHVHIVACGTSYHAGLIAKFWLENLAGLATSVEIASEYRYREGVVPANTLLIAVSQSGETADTLAALRKAKTLSYLTTLAICNVSTSSLVREADYAFLTRAGVEIGVASTKAFTTQLTALLMLAAALCKDERRQEVLEQLKRLPADCEQVLQMNRQIEQLAMRLVNKSHVLFLGRGMEYPVAMEGALKLKEISYIHAEAYPAGELKHGPLALVDGNMPVIVIAPNDELLDKLKSNLNEVSARGGQLFVLGDGSRQWTSEDAEWIQVPFSGKARHWVAPIIYVIPLQLLAYHVAVAKGTDIDQPRNLAKSVTVE